MVRALFITNIYINSISSGVHSYSYAMPCVYVRHAFLHSIWFVRKIYIHSISIHIISLWQLWLCDDNHEKWRDGSATAATENSENRDDSSQKVYNVYIPNSNNIHLYLLLLLLLLLQIYSMHLVVVLSCCCFSFFAVFHLS